MSRMTYEHTKSKGAYDNDNVHDRATNISIIDIALSIWAK